MEPLQLGDLSQIIQIESGLTSCIHPTVKGYGQLRQLLQVQLRQLLIQSLQKAMGQVLRTMRQRILPTQLSLTVTEVQVAAQLQCPWLKM